MNAVQRFIRSKVLLLTAAILIVAMCLSVLVQSQSQAALNRTVDENSRGLYDILVQAKAGSGVLMQPEIATGQGGISFDQLESIRDLPAPRWPRPSAWSRASRRTSKPPGLMPWTTWATTPASPAPPPPASPVARIPASGPPHSPC